MKWLQRQVYRALYLKESYTLRHLKHVYLKIFLTCQAVLVIIHWLLLYSCYSCEKLALVSHGDVTWGGGQSWRSYRFCC